MPDAECQPVETLTKEDVERELLKHSGPNGTYVQLPNGNWVLRRELRKGKGA
jgi:hypothetical protein